MVRAVCDVFLYKYCSIYKKNVLYYNETNDNLLLPVAAAAAGRVEFRM